MKKIAFITTTDARYGFSLTGITQYAVEIHDAEDTLKTITAEPENGLVIIDERLLTRIAEDRLREIEHMWHGILLVLPSPKKPHAEVEDFAARLIRRAIGYHVKLKL